MQHHGYSEQTLASCFAKVRQVTANRPWHHGSALAALQELHHKSKFHVVAALHYRQLHCNSTTTITARHRSFTGSTAVAALQELHHEQRLCMVAAGSWARCSIQQQLKVTV